MRLGRTCRCSRLPSENAVHVAHSASNLEWIRMVRDAVAHGWLTVTVSVGTASCLEGMTLAIGMSAPETHLGHIRHRS